MSHVGYPLSLEQLWEQVREAEKEYIAAKGRYEYLRVELARYEELRIGLSEQEAGPVNVSKIPEGKHTAL